MCGTVCICAILKRRQVFDFMGVQSANQTAQKIRMSFDAHNLKLKDLVNLIWFQAETMMTNANRLPTCCLDLDKARNDRSFTNQTFAAALWLQVFSEPSEPGAGFCCNDHLLLHGVGVLLQRSFAFAWRWVCINLGIRFA